MRLILTHQPPHTGDQLCAPTTAAAWAALRSGRVEHIHFAPDWHADAQAEFDLADRLCRAVIAEEIPRPDWTVDSGDAATRQRITDRLQRMDTHCRARAEIPRFPAPSASQCENLGLKPEFSLDNFVTGDSNCLAYTLAVLAGNYNINPLLICGASPRSCGQGKTHLLHAIARRRLQMEPTHRLRLQHAGELLADARYGQPGKMPKIEDLDLWLIDDLGILSRDPVQAAAVIKAIETLTLHGGMLVAAIESPEHPLAQELAKRMETIGRGVELALIAPPEKPLIRRLAQHFVERHDEKLADGLIDFLENTQFDNARELEGFMEKAFATQRYQGREMDEAMLRELGMSLFGTNHERY